MLWEGHELRFQEAGLCVCIAHCSQGRSAVSSALRPWCPHPSSFLRACRSVFEMVGGTCGSILVLAVPGALLISYASQKATESRQLLAQAPLSAGSLRQLLAQAPLSAGSLRQPLLGAAAAAAAAAADDAAEQGAGSVNTSAHMQLPPPLPQRPYTVLSSKMFWAGVALQLLAAFVFVLTVWRALS